VPRPDSRAHERAAAAGGREPPQRPARGGPQQPPDPHQIALGRVVRELRLEQDLSQEALASDAGIHRTYAGDIERGGGNPSYRNLRGLAAALGIPTSELLARAEALAE
jgi:DNA-binding XRE family transcriptional regulator